MCCPFHGRDSKPSLYYYLENNTFFCFGCPDGDGYWDNIKLVARSLEITRPQALRWLEAEFHLPPMADEQKPFDLDSVEGLVVLEEEEEDPEPPLLLNVEDLRAPYVAAARRLVWAQAGTSDAAPTARELLERFYRAIRAGDPVPLARIVGADVVRQLVQRAQRV